MAKAVLVIDMPESCTKCKLQDWPNCRIVKRCHIGDGRPDWCPLRELPDKMDGLMAAELVPDCENPVVYAQIWNALREKIVGD